MSVSLPVQVAAGKGLVSGPLEIHMQDSAVVDALQNLEASFLKRTKGGNLSNALKVEVLGILGRRARPFSNNLATRLFLHAIHVTRPEMPIYALLDFDPDGINILRCNKWGSTALQHEQKATVPRLRWLGIQSDDIMSILNSNYSFGIGRRDLDHATGSSFNLTSVLAKATIGQLIALTANDWKLATRLLVGLPTMGLDMDTEEVRRELQLMLMMNLKAEIQVMNEDGDVANSHSPQIMAPNLTEEEIDDLIFFSRAGDNQELEDSVKQLAEREKSSAAEIISAARDEGKSTCLHMATGNGHLETVKILLAHFSERPKAEKQEYVDAPNEYGNTALHWAALGGHLDVVKLLAEEHGATQAVANDRNYVALDLAQFNGHEDVAAYFLNQIKDLEGKHGTNGGLESGAAGIEIEDEGEADAKGRGSATAGGGENEENKAE
ncbi:hypothetical protein jhhlp_005837 [Lomentospora prolificans]|uniref:Topoisomerase 6 subunit A/Spo11 TOPRIM domain-containing protein n=1 Tax=Lomentospora prolificans TaxID=41688 RepID=A0A2N3N476_9PEZI|nr:hypothetical protein jhhlp_005837 [Lomentospora prolificans]